MDPRAGKSDPTSAIKITPAEAKSAADSMSDHAPQVDQNSGAVSQNLQGPYAIKKDPKGYWVFDIPEKIQISELNKDEVIMALKNLSGLPEEKCKEFAEKLIIDNKKWAAIWKTKNGKKPPEKNLTPEEQKKSNNELESMSTYLQGLKAGGIGDALGEGGYRICIETHKQYEKRIAQQVGLLKACIEGGADVLCFQEQPYALEKDKARQAIFKRVMEGQGYVEKANLDGRDVGIWVKQAHQAQYRALSDSTLAAKISGVPFRGCAIERDGVIYVNLHADRTKTVDLVKGLKKLKDDLEEYAKTKSAQIVMLGDLNLYAASPENRGELEDKKVGFKVEPVKGQEKFLDDLSDPVNGKGKGSPTCEVFLLAKEKVPKIELKSPAVAVKAPPAPLPSPDPALADPIPVMPEAKLSKASKKTSIEILRERADVLKIPDPINWNKLSRLSDETADKFLRETRPVADPKVIALMQAFIRNKKENGTEKEKALYRDMTPEKLVDRLLSKRPLVFYLETDAYLLRDGKTQGQGGFDLVGTDKETPPLTLDEYISYDEMKISALLGVSSPSAFINKGDRGNKGTLALGDSFEKEGYISGFVGARFEREGRMEFQDMIVTPTQNIPENGYGSDAEFKAKLDEITKANSKDPRIEEMQRKRAILNCFARQLYGLDYFPSYDKDNKPALPQYINVGKAGEDKYLNVAVYKERMRLVYEAFIADANERAKANGEKVVLRLPGLGTGVWAVNQSAQEQIIVSVLSDILKKQTFSNIAEIDLCYFFTKPNPTPPGPPIRDDLSANPQQRILADAAKGKNAGMIIKIDCIDPADKLDSKGVKVHAGYAWDGNAYPGNEYYLGKLSASGDPAAACFSNIKELHNPLLNPENVCGKNLKVCNAEKQVLLAEHVASHKVGVDEAAPIPVSSPSPSLPRDLPAGAVTSSIPKRPASPFAAKAEPVPATEPKPSSGVAPEPAAKPTPIPAAMPSPSPVPEVPSLKEALRLAIYMKAFHYGAVKAGLLHDEGKLALSPDVYRMVKDRAFVYDLFSELRRATGQVRLARGSKRASEESKIRAEHDFVSAYEAVQNALGQIQGVIDEINNKDKLLFPHVCNSEKSDIIDDTVKRIDVGSIEPSEIIQPPEAYVSLAKMLAAKPVEPPAPVHSPVPSPASVLSSPTSSMLTAPKKAVTSVLEVDPSPSAPVSPYAKSSTSSTVPPHAKPSAPMAASTYVKAVRLLDADVLNNMEASLKSDARFSGWQIDKTAKSDGVEPYMVMKDNSDNDKFNIYQTKLKTEDVQQDTFVAMLKCFKEANKSNPGVLPKVTTQSPETKQRWLAACAEVYPELSIDWNKQIALRSASPAPAASPAPSVPVHSPSSSPHKGADPSGPSPVAPTISGGGMMIEEDTELPKFKR